MPVTIGGASTDPSSGLSPSGSKVALNIEGAGVLPASQIGAHGSNHVGADPIQSATTTVPGLMTAAHASALATAGTNISNLQSTVSGHTTALTSQATSISDLETDVGVLTGNVGDLQTADTALQGTVSGHTSSLTSQASAITSLQSADTALSAVDAALDTRLQVVEASGGGSRYVGGNADLASKLIDCVPMFENEGPKRSLNGLITLRESTLGAIKVRKTPSAIRANIPFGCDFQANFSRLLTNFTALNTVIDLSTQSYTICSWVYADIVSTSYAMGLMGDWQNLNGYGFYLAANANNGGSPKQIVYGLTSDGNTVPPGNTDAYALDSSLVINATTLYLVSVEFEAGVGMRVGLNGVKSATTTFTGTPWITPNQDIAFGGLLEATNQLDGMMTQLSFWRGILTTQNYTDLINSGAGIRIA